MKFRTMLNITICILLCLTICVGCKSKPKTIAENWTDLTKNVNIPTTPIAGKINDKEIKIAYVKVKKWPDSYNFSFSSMKPESTCGIIMDDDAVDFSAKNIYEGTFGKLMEQSVKFDDYHAYYHYEQDNGVPMSVNTDWSAKVTINKIDKETNKITGWAEFKFSDGKTEIAGAFEADFCE